MLVMSATHSGRGTPVCVRESPNIEQDRHVQNAPSLNSHDRQTPSAVFGPMGVAAVQPVVAFHDALQKIAVPECARVVVAQPHVRGEGVGSNFLFLLWVCGMLFERLWQLMRGSQVEREDHVCLVTPGTCWISISSIIKLG